MQPALLRTARLPVVARRFFSTTPSVMAGGDVGSGVSRPGGERAGDAWTKREKGNEDQYIRQEELAKLRAIKAKLDAHREHINELDRSITDMMEEHQTKGQGEHN